MIDWQWDAQLKAAWRKETPSTFFPRSHFSAIPSLRAPQPSLLAYALFGWDNFVLADYRENGERRGTSKYTYQERRDDQSRVSNYQQQ